MRVDDLSAILNSTLEPLERLVLIAVASHINSDGAKAWPSIERLAQMTGLNKSTVTDRIAKMQSAGVLVRRRRFAQSSVYEIATIPQSTSAPLNGDAVYTAAPLSDAANDHSTAVPTIIRRPHRKELSNEPSKENNPISSAMAEDDGFNEFWNAYRKKVGRHETETKWRGMSRTDRAAAMAGIAAYHARQDQKFWKDPVRYLRHRVWEDEPTPVDGESCPHPAGSTEWWDWYAAHPEKMSP